MKVLEFLQNRHGQFSSMRLIFLIGSISGLILCFFAVDFKLENPKESIGEFTALIGVVFGFVGGLKFGQKYVENNEPGNGNTG